MAVADNTPILVGAGQYVERTATLNSPMALATEATRAAIEDSQGEGIAEAIDTIAVVKLFSDSAKMWECPFGRSDNPPQSIAAAIGANPEHRIYTQTGGNQPQSLVIEMAAKIARGESSMALLAGAEAIRNQRSAQRSGEQPQWDEHFEEPLDDRGFGDMVATNQERHNGMVAPMFYYSMIEQARRSRSGQSIDDYKGDAATLLETLSSVAANNPMAQFPGSMSSEEILTAAPLTHLYSKRMIAQDGVNQAAALLICSAGKARELNIPEDRWIFIHGMAEGSEVDLSEREDIATSAVATRVVDRAMEMAQVSIDDIDLIDIYSCFPCAITVISDHLGLPADGSRALTITGGLPYFGGPGNNYSMHALAETVTQLHENPQQVALVTTNGGLLSKHASAVYSCQPCALDWSKQDTKVTLDQPRLSLSADPGSGTVIAYTLNYFKEHPAQMIAMAETDQGERFVCCTAEDDQNTVMASLETEPTGRRIAVRTVGEHTLHFTYAD